MLEIIKGENIWFKVPVEQSGKEKRTTHGRNEFRSARLSRVTYTDRTSEDFQIIRGSIAWPRVGIPGLILVGGIPCGGDVETIKVLEEAEFHTLPECRKILDAYAGKYNETLYCVYYQNVPESEGFVNYLVSGDKSRQKPWLKVAPYTESIDYNLQLVNSHLAAQTLKVPGEGLLATQLQARWDATSNEKDLFSVIALASLISGMQARFDGMFSEDTMENLPEFPLD